MSEAEFIIRFMNPHQVLIIVVDTRILCCVADSLQERSFASISPTDYKDAKVSIFCSEVIGITAVAHFVVDKGKETAWERCRNHRGETLPIRVWGQRPKKLFRYYYEVDSREPKGNAGKV